MPRSMYFIDGENLTFRFQEMVKEGRQPLSEVIHEQDVFVWHPEMIGRPRETVVRVLYYTSAVGDDDRILSFQEKLHSQRYSYIDDDRESLGKVVPRVFKKHAKSKKTKTVDINITTDLLTHVFNRSLDKIYLYSGDIDFEPVIRFAMAQGIQVGIRALSSGLAQEMRILSDAFEPLDFALFEPFT
ncbi:hypothetical protein BH24GEM3_BH24GEM3_08440 [soil metagenome]|jgi:hypothetical protein